MESWQEDLKRYDENWKALQEQDAKAKEHGTMVGRVIKHPFADGYAVYLVIKENKKTVRIRVCTGLGDDWVLPAWGTECSIPKSTALSFIEWEDTLQDVFGGK